MFAHIAFERFRIHLVSGLGQHVRRQHGVATGSGGTDRDREIDVGVGIEQLVDLAQLHTEPAHLHLEVTTPHVFERVPVPAGVHAVAHEVAGAVEPRARLTVRIRDETLGGDLRTIVVPAGDPWAGEVQLTDDTTGNHTQPGVEDAGGDATQRRPDRDLGAGRQRRGDGDDDRGLGGAVGIS